MKTHKNFELRVATAGDAAYLKIGERSLQEISKTTKQVRLLDLLPDYKGADIYLDFDQDDTLRGVEILL